METDYNLHFIFWRHIEDNVPAVLNRVENFDVLLLEGVPLEQKRNTRLQEALANVALGAELERSQHGILNYTFGEKAAAINYELISPRAKSMLDPLTCGIIDSFNGSGKTLRYLDVNPTDHKEVVDGIKNSNLKASNLNEDIQLRKIDSFEQYRIRTKELITLQSRDLALRDTIVSQQIAGLRKHNGDKKIAVIYGSNHTGISHEFIRDGCAQREFVTADGSTPMCYNIDSQALRSARFDKTVSYDSITKLLYKNCLRTAAMQARDPGSDIQAQADKMANFDKQTLDISDACETIASHATDEEIHIFIDLTDACLRKPNHDSVEAMSDFLSSKVKLLTA